MKEETPNVLHQGVGNCYVEMPAFGNVETPEWTITTGNTFNFMEYQDAEVVSTTIYDTCVEMVVLQTCNYVNTIYPASDMRRVVKRTWVIKDGKLEFAGEIEGTIHQPTDEYYTFPETENETKDNDDSEQ